MREWDYRAAQRPDVFIANSVTTQGRIAAFYQRESSVVYPFFQSNCFDDTITKKEEYYVCLGRIVPYKRFDLAIEACNQL
jgi:glycosyltransferase involved in cell wall biosynthesis